MLFALPIIAAAVATYIQFAFLRHDVYVTVRYVNIEMDPVRLVLMAAFYDRPPPICSFGYHSGYSGTHRIYSRGRVAG
jgi:hypothetical protein